jgi:hypothetical protein
MRSAMPFIRSTAALLALVAGTLPVYAQTWTPPVVAQPVYVIAAPLPATPALEALDPVVRPEIEPMAHIAVAPSTITGGEVAQTINGTLALDQDGANQLNGCMSRIAINGGLNNAIAARQNCMSNAVREAYVLPDARVSAESSDWTAIRLERYDKRLYQ